MESIDSKQTFNLMHVTSNSVQQRLFDVSLISNFNGTMTQYEDNNDTRGILRGKANLNQIQIT